jgi:uncharacterized protein involved in exopolysaccharide biosynthesis
MSDLTPKTDACLSSTYPDDEIHFKELFMVLWSSKWLISAFTSAAASVSVMVVLLFPNIYTANALLAPAKNSSAGLSGLMKQYGGLASLAGVSLSGGEEGSSAQLRIQLTRSRSFIGDFVVRHDILPELMAVESWEVGSGTLVFDSKAYDASSKTWVRDVERPKLAMPSMLEAHEEFMSVLGISEDKQTGYVTVSVEHHSPNVAAQWVSWLVEDINAVVKAQDVDEAFTSIEYLTQQIANTSLAELQAMFFELIQSQTESIMLAEVRPEYVFKAINSAVIPEEKSKPSRLLICVLGTLLGGDA